MISTDAEPVLVLGGGLMGLTIAHQLALAGKAVRIFNRSNEEAAGFVAAGMLAPHAEGLQGPLLRLGQLSQQKVSIWIETIEAESNIKCGLIQPNLSLRDPHIFSPELCRTYRFEASYG